MTEEITMNSRAFLFATVVVTGTVHAGDLTIPNSFTADTAAVAAEVNANFNAVEAEVDDNAARLTTLEGFAQLVDASDTVIGSIVGMNTDLWTVINTSGFLVQLRADGFPGFETVYFDGMDCTGTPYIRIGNSGASTASAQNSVWIKQGYVVTDSIDDAIYHVPKNSSVLTAVTHESRYLTSGCQNTNGTMDAVAMQLNVPSTTGVPNAGYGPVSLP